MELQKHCNAISSKRALQRIEEEINDAMEKSLTLEPGEDVRTYSKDPEWILLEDIMYIIRKSSR